MRLSTMSSSVHVATLATIVAVIGIVCMSYSTVVSGEHMESLALAYGDDNAAHDLYTLEQVVQRMKKNLANELKADGGDFKRADELCKKSLSNYHAQIGGLQGELTAAKENVVTQQNMAAELTEDIKRLSIRRDSKATEVKQFKEQIPIGDKARAAAKLDYATKKNATDKMLESLALMHARLTQIKKSTFAQKKNSSSSSSNGTARFQELLRFRQSLSQAADMATDAAVQLMVRSALSNIDISKGPINSEDIDQLHSLISLLIADLQSYLDEREKAENMAEAIWTERKQEIKEQIGILQNDVDAKTKAVNLKKTGVARAQASLNASTELINYLPTLIKVMSAESFTLNAKCAYDGKHHHMEVASLQKQHAAISAVLTLAQGNADLSKKLVSRMTSVNLPKLQLFGTRRCCMMCKKDMKACGDKCIPVEDACGAVDGCACDELTGSKDK
jgi:hypothetical protein